MRKKGNLGVDDHKSSGVVGVACSQELKKEGGLLKNKNLPGKSKLGVELIIRLPF